MGFGNIISSIPEGTHLSIRYPDDNSRIKSGQGISYWTRSPSNWDSSANVRAIADGGYGEADYAYNSTRGIAPIIVIH